VAVSSFAPTISVRVPVGDEEVVLVLRRPSAAEVSRFHNNRFKQHGRRFDNVQGTARIEFIDSILLDVENATYTNAEGVELALNAKVDLEEADRRYAASILGAPVDSWKQLVNPTWKISAAMQFEESHNTEIGAGPGAVKN
jgi:hypothetical protein